MESKLPKGWKIEKLGEIASINMGQSPESSTYNKGGDGLPFFQGKAEFGKLNPTPVKWCDSPIKVANKGDILISVRAPVGDVNIANERCCIGRGLASLSGENNMYLFYYLISIKSELERQGTGSTFKAISGVILKETIIPYPPLAEQQRIVDKIDRVFERLDKSIALVEENIGRAKALKASILSKSFHEGEELPEGWKEDKVDDISTSIQYGFTGKTVDESGFKYLRITDIQNSKVDWISVPFVDITNNEAEKYLLKIGDIVFARTGATAGKSFLIKNIPVKSVFASYLIRVVCDENKILPDFLYLFFQSPGYWNHIASNVEGAAQPNFNGKKLADIQIRFPKQISEQQRIVAQLDQLFSRIDRIIAEQENKLQQLKAMKASVLDKAFRGEM